MAKSIVQDWVAELGLRHQGCLMSAVRGCDGVPREDPSKAVVRALRGVLLNAHCGDAPKAATFIEKPSTEELLRRFNVFLASTDHLPLHFVLHLLHAMEIIGYKHPDIRTRATWRAFYTSLCIKLHLNWEEEDQLDHRLNLDEESFAARNQA